ncbi:uncharacterized protein LOC119104616 [Pollicipes pollicipes]|uniref:uncharacterized protein LOC119104616 n=1 Tax=Pollicipes pollicipes TaxID=41117 RepID=UPI001884E1A9|nr:uncharacterized protein LOC119104616 [Pollicipes pollicipes]
MLRQINDTLVRMRLRRLTKENLLYFYYPMKGASCYVLFAGHVMHPAILSSFPLVPRSVPVSNLALVHANLGIGLYLFGSRHLRHQHICKKVTFSVFGSLLFNMGSVLLFAILRQATPECATFRAMIGMTSAAGLLYIGKTYVDHLDRQAVLHDAE